MDFLLQNWWYILLFGGFAFMMFRGGGCCGGGHSHDGHGDHAEHSFNNRQNGSRNKIDMVRDPECGMHIDTFNSIKQTIDGETYYFCSETCRSNFVQKKLGNKSA